MKRNSATAVLFSEPSALEQPPRSRSRPAFSRPRQRHPRPPRLSPLHPPSGLAFDLEGADSNLSTGRNMAGIHYRTDMSEGLRLGEEVAISILQEQAGTCTEGGSFTLTRFNGEALRIG